MKKTNIAFSGFMAAILFGAGAANAATQIASKTYVDNQKSEVLQTVNQIQESVTTVTEQVTNLGDTINNEETGLAKEVSDLKTSVESKLDSDTAAATYEVLTNKSQNLNTDAASTEKYPSAKAVVDWVNEKVTDGIEINTDKIQNGAITEEKLSEDLSQKIDGKEDKSNKVTTLNPESLNATTEYPSVSAVATWTQEQIAAAEFDPSKIEAGAISGDKITDGTITGTQIQDGSITGTDIASGTISSDNLDSSLNAEISGKQDKNIPGATDHVVITDGEGNITTAAQIAADKVSGLSTVATTGAYSDLSGTPTIPTTVAELTDAGNYATTTALTDGLAAKQDKLGYTAEDVANKAKTIDEGNKASDSLYPTVGAITTWVSSEISDLSELPVNPGLIEDGTLAGSKLQNGAISTEKIADGAVTTDKLGSDVKATIDGKANASDVYTKVETDDKIVELAVPKPDATCMAESGLCVLSVTPEGTVAWVNVTQPAE